ncbi:MAG: 50S ribosomal protein L4 [Patescibacteria group bacterium]
MKAPVYSIEGKEVGEMELRPEIFGARWNPDLVRQALLAQLGNRRSPLAHAKTRGEVSGGGKKPWRQKGTGRARHGSIRSPIWKGGGVTHGPRNDKSYTLKINKKMRTAAIRSVVSKKFAGGDLKIIEVITLSAPKTKELAGVLRTFLKAPKAGKLSALLIPAEGNRVIYRASANIPSVKSVDPRSINVEDLLGHRSILIERKAVEELKI